MNLDRPISSARVNISLPHKARVWNHPSVRLVLRYFLTLLAFLVLESPAAVARSLSLGYQAGQGTVLTELIRGNELGGGIGGLLYTVEAGAATHNLYNSRGDVICQTSAAGAFTYGAQYEAFGTRKAEAFTAKGRQKANTKDEAPTGLLNEGFRYRDLEAGVFITRDPAGFVDGPNVYTYVRQNPWTMYDPDGLKISVGGKRYEGEARGKNAREKDIFRHYEDAPEEFRFDSIEKLDRTLWLRSEIIESARKVQARTEFTSGDYRKFGDCWRINGNGGEHNMWITTEGIKDLGRAMNALTTVDGHGQGYTAVDCCGGATIAYLLALNKVYPEYFKFSPSAETVLVSTVDPYELTKGMIDIPGSKGPLLNQFWKSAVAKGVNPSRANATLIPGDWVYFENDGSYDQTKGAWKGEHAIYMGENSLGKMTFIGHGLSGEPTAKEITTRLQEELVEQLGDGYRDKKLNSNPMTVFKP